MFVSVTRHDQDRMVAVVTEAEQLGLAPLLMNHVRAPLGVPSCPNERWSLDFLSDSFTDGRRFRILAVVDDCTRECLGLVADTSLSGGRVARELDGIMVRRGRPKTCLSDNGTELTSMAILAWSKAVAHVLQVPPAQDH